MNPYINRLPSLIALRAFVIVGETLSVRRAGEILNTDHASISRHISNLEASLGRKLLSKGRHGLELTPDGAQYHRKFRRAFDIICDTCQEASAKPTRSLSISSTPGIAHGILVPALPRLSARLPGWSINLSTTVTPLFEESSPNVTRVYVTYGPKIDLGKAFAQIPIAAPRMFPVASPAFLAAHPVVESVKDMLKLPFIRSDSTGLWEQWCGQAGIDQPLMLAGPDMPDTSMAIQAALLGHGIALGNSMLVNAVIRSGALVEILDTDIYLDSYNMIASSRDLDQSPIREMQDWLKEETSTVVSEGTRLVETGLPAPYAVGLAMTGR